MILGLLKCKYRFKTANEDWDDTKHIWKDGELTFKGETKEAIIALVKNKMELQMKLSGYQYKEYSLSLADVLEEYNVVFKIELEKPKPVLEV
jgi:hypothetical protein